MGLPEKLQELLERRGISVAELTRQCAVRSESTVHRWLSGKSTPRLGELVELARVFDVQLSVLTGDPSDIVAFATDGLNDDERLVLEFYRALRDDPSEGMNAHEAMRRLRRRPPVVGGATEKKRTP
jgi:transcriptional regulator with XRE-family HTH domain